MQIKKYFKIGVYEIYALAIIIFGTLLRVLLTALKWPLFNSDEGTMGIMALHIAYRGEHPIFYYGQNYMGTLDAYLGAGLFRVFGPSIFTLRIGVILLYIPFMVVMYFLTSILYTKKMALGSLVLLSLGSIPVLYMEVRPLVYSDILFFGACVFLIASWLTLTYNQDVVQRRRWWRLLGYACWGCVTGLAVWSDPLILPYLASASLLLVVFCWREMLFKFGGICLLLGLVVGAFPLLVYNLKAPPGQDSLSIFFAQTRPAASVPGSFTPLSLHILNTMLYYIPTATGNPLCLNSQGPINTLGLRCAMGLESWSLGLIILGLVAVLLAILALWKLKHGFFGRQPSSTEQKRAITCEFARLMLLVSAGLTVLFFTLSTASIPSSYANARYLHCLLISLPAVMWPLWLGASKVEPPGVVAAKIKVGLSRGLLLLICIIFLAGTIAAFFDIHTSRSVEQDREAMIHKLESMNIKHFYTDDYWTCYRMAFASSEKITCAVIGPNLLPYGSDRNRYWPYVLQVQADPHVAYVLPMNDPHTPVIVRNAQLANRNYFRVDLYGYVVYQPSSTAKMARMR